MNLVTLTHPQSAAAEAYRTLRANLQFATADAPLKTILVASPDSNTTAVNVLANLAVTLAQNEKRVVVVDADLREPVLHTVFELPNTTGLADWLHDGPGVNGTGEPRLHVTAVPGLSVLTSGTSPAIATDVISSVRMTQAIDSLSQLADVVLFNAPPLVTFSDAAILASKVGGTLLVVDAGKTRRDSAQQAKDILARAHAHLIGAVMLGAK